MRLVKVSRLFGLFLGYFWANFSHKQAFIHWHPFSHRFGPYFWGIPYYSSQLSTLQQQRRVLAAASVGGLEALFSLTSDLARLSWHIETRRTSWLDDQCTNLFEALLYVENIKVLVMHDIIMEFSEKYELIVIKSFHCLAVVRRKDRSNSVSPILTDFGNGQNFWSKFNQFWSQIMHFEKSGFSRVDYFFFFAH